MEIPLKLAADDGGPPSSSPTLVFLHSAGGNGAHFAHQLAFFRQTRRAVTLDLRGHGRSSGARVDDVDVHARDVLATLDALKVERMVLVGHSWGAAVALSTASLAPSRVAGLFLLDPASDARAIPKAEAAGLLDAIATHYEPTVTAYWRSLLEGARPAGAELVLTSLLANDHDVVIGTLASLLSWDPVTKLNALTMPRHALVTRFNDVPSAWHRLAPSLPSSRIENTSHWPQLDEPAQVNRAIAGFIEHVE